MYKVSQNRHNVFPLHANYHPPQTNSPTLSNSREAHGATLQGKTALVTGGARRIGAAISRHLHGAGANVAIHYRSSGSEARQLRDTLVGRRAGSAEIFQADLTDLQQLHALVDSVSAWRNGLDVLVNNASSFYPTPLGRITEDDWQDLVDTNLKAPLFLAQAAWPSLRARHGAIVNLIDIHAKRPLRDHAVYGSAKAGLEMLTRTLAREMAPGVRVNGVAPGAILWPEQGMTEEMKQKILSRIPLERGGDPEDIAGCVLYLVRDAAYVTGQVIAIDGGRSIGW
ncbi:MAG: pteridine reductase [Woeseia sp.]